MSTELSMRIKTVYAVLNSYRTLSVESLLEPLADNFTYRVLPQYLSMPKRDKKSLRKPRSSNILNLHEVCHGASIRLQRYEKQCSFIYAKTVGELKSLGPWEDKSLLMMMISEDGTKVSGD